ncbi:putative zinc-binding metallopeptidase [Fulvivirgaceae bacterium PWU4]|uniref:Zinc-binding metallopeptidase n=1 Tax=Chryseosolibacter histidini TaxID=2782349 RepID=A0AAP2DFQ6_9BACT|nr:putative zinc-binding metallopeptidase [Chryseosolibacter histidini]MBT1695643.1 putative zinc-binding metallopeptidase [Chryseosolibacter histidini]
MKNMCMHPFNKKCARITVVLAALLVTMMSCSDEDTLDVSFLDTDPSEKSAIDLWIDDNYTSPFNIAVEYKWDPYELPSNRVLVPVKEDKVIPVMKVVKDTWIDPYVLKAGEAFVKEHAPKQFLLVGSAKYNDDGTIVLGEAESGRKVTLFVVNDFNRQNVPAVKQMLHTIHHEFAHILHQTILYPREYKQVTPSGYTASWYNTDDATARALGFITPYARASSDEDFVEMISMMLVEGRAGYEAILSKVPEEGRALLRKKEAFVVAYFKQSWNIDFYSLQTATQEAITKATGN